PGVGTAPAGHQVVTGYGRIAAGCAAGDVVEVRVIDRRHILRIDGRVDEADGRLAVLSQLLVDQGDVARPHGRRKAGAAVIVGRAGGLIRADIKSKVGV